MTIISLVSKFGSDEKHTVETFFIRITLVSLMASSTVYAFKMSADPNKIEFIAIMLIVTNIVDPSTLENKMNEFLYFFLISAFVLISIVIMLIVLRIWTVPYDCIFFFCPCLSDKNTTIPKTKFSKKHISNRLRTLSQARKRPAIKDDNEQTDENSVEISPMSPNENQESDQLTNELIEDEIYDRRNFIFYASI